MDGVSLHRRLEANAGLLVFGILFVSAIGGLVQVLPTVFQDSLVAPAEATRPYPPLELIGRDIYPAARGARVEDARPCPP